MPLWLPVSDPGWKRRSGLRRRVRHARQALYYVFASDFAKSDRGRHRAYQDVASLAIKAAPIVSVYSALLEFREERAEGRDAQDYNYAVALRGAILW